MREPTRSFIRYVRRTIPRGKRVSLAAARIERQHDPSISGRRGPRRDREWIVSPVSAPALTDENRPGRVQREKVI